MKRSEVKIGSLYLAKVAGVLSPVRLTAESSYWGWYAINERTGRKILIRSAAKLRREILPTTTA